MEINFNLWIKLLRSSQGLLASNWTHEQAQRSGLSGLHWGYIHLGDNFLKSDRVLFHFFPTSHPRVLLCRYILYSPVQSKLLTDFSHKVLVCPPHFIYSVVLSTTWNIFISHHVLFLYSSREERTSILRSTTRRTNKYFKILLNGNDVRVPFRRRTWLSKRYKDWEPPWVKGGERSESQGGIPLFPAQCPILSDSHSLAQIKQKRGCINISFSLSEEQTQPWNSRNSSGKHQPARKSHRARRV